MILCGLKSDLRHKRTCIDLLKTQGLTPVTPEQGTAVANKMGAVYMECSAKERVGIEEIFDKAICMTVDAEEEQKDMLAGRGRGASANGRSSGLSSSKRKKRAQCKFL